MIIDQDSSSFLSLTSPALPPPLGQHGDPHLFRGCTSTTQGVSQSPPYHVARDRALSAGEGGVEY
jgi:hypothetical protein